MPWSPEAKKGESGLVDRMWFHVAKARYGFPYENASDQCALVLDGERNINGELSDDHIWLKVGAFEPGDKEGTFIIHESQEEGRHPNKNSGIGKFLASANEVGLMDVLEQRQDPSRAQYEEKDALIWEGLDLDIEYVEQDFKLRQGPEAGKVVTSRQPYIRGFKADGAESSSTATPGTETPSNNGSIDVAAIAKQSDNYLAFLENYVKAGGSESDEAATQAAYQTAKSS